MAEFKPFRAIVYNREHIDIGSVVSPPYDVITPKEQDLLYQRSPYNIVRIILNKEESDEKYRSANRFLKQWLEEGILLMLDKSVFFIYEQEFTVDGNNFTRRALVGRIRIEEFEKGVILPHEKTLSAPKEDRYKLIKATNVQSEPIFGIAIDDGNIESLTRKALEEVKEPLFEFSDENGVSHKLYHVSEIFYNEIEEAFLDKKILIADGHHRYETALRIKREYEREPNYDPQAPYNYILMCVVSSKDRGLIIQPIYRLITIEKKYIEKLMELAKKIEKLEDLNKINYKMLSKNEFIMVTFTSILYIELNNIKNERTSVQILHNEIIHNILEITEEDISSKGVIKYFKKLDEAIENMKENDLLIVYNPPTPEEISLISEKGKILPQKSTFFYPKFYSGLFMYPLW
ncbi:MAG: DUF1015 family protein [Thermosulfidibacteraceae bacterium]|jgi:uncharacterized protein (DUF1015 family)